MLRGDNGIVIRVDQNDVCARDVSSRFEMLIVLSIVSACLPRREQAFVQGRLLLPCQHQRESKRGIDGKIDIERVYTAAA